jgi:nucleotide-binding universal stress UspA family protein
MDLRLVHVSADPRAPVVLGTAEEHLLASERKMLAEAAAALRADAGVPVEKELCAGPIADAITAAAERVVATAIVVAGRRRLGLGLGKDVTERVARQARLPVLAMRAPERFEAWLRGERPLRVMVGSDLGAASTRALRFAGRELARMGPVKITLACIAAPDETSIRLGLPLPADGSALLPAAEVALRGELDAQIRDADVSGPVRIIVRAGTAAPETHLSVLAENELVDVLVVGTRRHSWIERLWSGSTSRGVLHAASTNIICVPRLLVEERPAVPSTPRVLVAATDLSPLGDAAVPIAYALVTAGGTVHLLHVVDAGPLHHLGERAREAELVNRLAERIPPDAAGKHVRTECHVVFGRAADEIVSLAVRVAACAICVGSRGRSGIGAAVLGSVSAPR